MFTFRHLFSWRFLVRVLALVAGAASVPATTVRPPSLGELIGGSELIFRGRVTAVQTAWRGSGPTRHPATLVSFAVEETIKGAAAAGLNLEFVGGSVPGHQLKVVGLPEFKPGDRGVFFVENRGNRLCPIRRLRHGRYRIVPDAAGTERMARDDHSPLTSSAAVGEAFAAHAPPPPATTRRAAITAAQFQTDIATWVRADHARGGAHLQ